MKEQIQYIQKIQRLAKSIQKKNNTHKINHKDEQRVNKVKKTNKSMQ